MKGQRRSLGEYRTVVGSEESNFETSACRDMHVGADELN
jgi:hypothetical protein